MPDRDECPCKKVFNWILSEFRVIGSNAVQKLKILEKNGNVFSSFVCFYMFFCCFPLNATSSYPFAVFFALCRAFGPPRYRLLLLLLTLFDLISVKISESLSISNQRVAYSVGHFRAFCVVSH